MLLDYKGKLPRLGDRVFIAEGANNSAGVTHRNEEWGQHPKPCLKVFSFVVAWHLMGEVA